MDDVLRRLEGEIPADGPGRGFVRTGRAVDGPDDADRVRPVEGEGDERGRSDEVDQAREEWLVTVRCVVALGEAPIDLDELESDDLEPA